MRRKKNFSKARKKKRTATDIGVNDAKNGKRLRVKCDGQYIKGKIPIYLSMDSQEEEFNNEKEVKDGKC